MGANPPCHLAGSSSPPVPPWPFPRHLQIGLPMQESPLPCTPHCRSPLSIPTLLCRRGCSIHARDVFLARISYVLHVARKGQSFAVRQLLRVLKNSHGSGTCEFPWLHSGAKPALLLLHTCIFLLARGQQCSAAPEPALAKLLLLFKCKVCFSSCKLNPCTL